ncbi:predicted protein [Aspergillus nidulans FGSC A4]|uniref:DUF7580 domain-containing protein n=1 Tax=Emericella nidulans (strain FGSC A4 / ATCC 38163 / CBS 112.46 / NRRL 194 / M139) TaxID=227321 RepID=Q5AU09_EMENI|nr:hypothetical protein [Aspergillus nidulans FGSC A4]EAA58877.1 predicted protein [Aspergillus nidulans FGSC A4]CBF74142.1 TPA: conserved hypothetical protein [Aspergillus nidulans FGSC A4]|eukprot:XP_681490.1 predicted protein [Aspergillus nidulans FGSC A4]
MASGIEVAGLTLSILPLLIDQINGYVRGIEKNTAFRSYRRELKGCSVGLSTQQTILLNTLKQALEGVVDDVDQIQPTQTLNIRKSLKLVSRAVYNDLLYKIGETNTILQTLIDQSAHREDTRKSRRPWSYLLKRYRKALKHAEGLFMAIIRGNCWRCRCKEQHCVHLQLQTNPLQSTDEYFHCKVDDNSQFRIAFSNTDSAEAKVQFDIPVVGEARPSKLNNEALSAPLIQDFCSYLCAAEPHIRQRESMGSISNELGNFVKCKMHTVKMLPKPVTEKPLSEVLSQISRRDRLYVAAGLACGVTQFCGNWLKPWWNSLDVHLAAVGDGTNVLLDNLYLSWAVSAMETNQGPRGDDMCSGFGNNQLLALGLALVELPLGTSLQQLLALQEENQDTLVAKLKSASWLVKLVYMESGTNYADAVDSCLYWSALCVERSFEEPVIYSIISFLRC